MPYYGEPNLDELRNYIGSIEESSFRKLSDEILAIGQWLNTASQMYVDSEEGELFITSLNPLITQLYNQLYLLDKSDIYPDFDEASSSLGALCSVIRKRPGENRDRNFFLEVHRVGRFLYAGGMKLKLS